jgi:predicted nuclease with TOPRIM domain
MDKEFYDKYSKDLECSYCPHLEHCINGKEPLKINCAIHFFKDKTTDLEAKLAESESKSYTLESYNNFLNNQCKKLIKENKQLKQQLAEKDELLKQKICDMKSTDFQTAIAELENVKEMLEPKYFDKEQINYLTNAIDQQIKSLKGEKYE